ncbi:MAG: hypothetical protein ACO3A4_07790 [Silvanigrellaceae bacterium]
MKKFGFIAALAIVMNGCAYSVHQYGATDFTGMRPGKKVVAEGSRHYFFAKTDNGFVESAYASLVSQCKNGIITGITSQYRTELSFLSFTEKLIIEGTCVTQ